jgi:hypothetical protein
MTDAASYLALIIPEHQGQPDFAATILLSVQPFVDAQNTLSALVSEFDVDTAVGVQLDAVGVRVGISRYVKTQLPNVYFSWDVTGLGWRQGVWKGPFDPTTGLTRLDDDVFRLLIYAKIAANSWDGTVAGAAAALANLFNNSETPGTLLFVQDNYDMTMTVAVSGELPPAVFLALLATGEIPLRPVGVGVNYVQTSVDNTPCFGWGMENEYVSGWGVGAWATPVAA